MTVTHTMRQARIDALARRAATQQGAVRTLLEARLAALMAQQQSAEQRSSHTPAATAPITARGPLGQLVDGLTARHETKGGPPDGVESQSSPGGLATGQARRELATLRRFRGTWSRLSAQERLRQTLAQVPSQAGPLNSHHLVHRALALMQEASPGYLQHFVGYVDALLWLEQQQAPLPPPAARTARSEPRRKAPVRKR